MYPLVATPKPGIMDPRSRMFFGWLPVIVEEIKSPAVGTYRLAPPRMKIFMAATHPSSCINAAIDGALATFPFTSSVSSCPPARFTPAITVSAAMMLNTPTACAKFCPVDMRMSLCNACPRVPENIAPYW